LRASLEAAARLSPMSFSCRSSNCRKARRPLRRCCQVRRTARPRARSAWIRCQTRLDGRVRTVRGYVAVFIITAFFWNVSCPSLASWRSWRPAPGPPAPPSRSAHQPCLQGDVAALPVLAAGRCQCDSGRLSPWLSCCARERVGAERCSRMRPPALPCRPSHGKETVLHYPARHDHTRRVQPADDPVVLWLQGGGTSLLIISHTFCKFGRHGTRSVCRCLCIPGCQTHSPCACCVLHYCLHRPTL
jgi:hypothetical protein